MNKTLYLFLLFLFLLFLQVFILNKINLFGYVNPYVYIAFVFLFPLKKDKFPVLTFSFLLGLAIDFFMDSGGVNAMAALSIAYLRLHLFKRFFQKSENDYELFNFSKEPFGDVFNYIAILTVVHHFILFTLINFSFNNFLKNVILNTFFSSIFTLLIYFLGSFILRRNTNET